MDNKAAFIPRTAGLSDILLRMGILTSEQCESVIKECDPTQKNFGQVAVALGFTTEEKIQKAVSIRLGIPYFPSFEGMIDPSVKQLVPEAMARKHLIVPLIRNEDALTIGMVNPVDVIAIDELSHHTGLKMMPVMTSLATLLNAIVEVYGKTLTTKPLEDLASAPATVAANLTQAEDGSVIEMVNGFLQEGMKRGASDIHLEVGEKIARVRFRVDGLLQDGKTYDKDIHAGLVARIKILSRLDLTETRLPQDGHLRFEYKGVPIDVRISTVPSVHGEKAVLRLLDSTKSLRPLSELNFSPSILKAFSAIIRRSNRIILVTGPTGSGKTSTLYAALSELNEPTCNIITLEDPVEYRLERITQIEALPKIGLTFATGLRAILRQDPNVILVGEIRDAETAEIAIQAAITGHRVFSTLHTPNAVTAVHRLIMMRVEPFLIAAALGGVMAQRLARRLCPACKRPHVFTEAEKDAFGARLHTDKTFFEPVGCKECFNNGYDGRFAVHEWLPVTRGIKDLILRRASVDEITDLAKKEGLITLQEDAFSKAEEGLTSLMEVMRITEQEVEG